LAPSPRKSFVVGTFLREEQDPCGEPSMVAFVDPSQDEGKPERRTYAEDDVRRANYASWLRGMGFEDSAAQLVGRLPHQGLLERTLETVDLPTGSRTVQFAVSVWGFFPEHGAQPEIHAEPLGALETVARKLPPAARFLVSGIESSVANQLHHALRQPDADVLMKLPTLPDVHPPVDGPIVGSIFPDGTFLGSIEAGFVAKGGTRPFRLS
jgi:hypothetical protein